MNSGHQDGGSPAAGVAGSADLLAAHRWTRDRVLEALVTPRGVAQDSSPNVRNGVVLGPAVALLVTAVALWGSDVQAWVLSRVG